MNELRLLFWNVKRNVATVQHVAALCEELEPHVLLTAETPLGDRLTHACPKLRRVSPVTPARVETFVRSDEFRVRAKFGADRAEGFVVEGANIEPHLLVAVHLESGLWQQERDQEHAADRLHRTVMEWETELDHRRTIVIGDFNMDPHSPAMVSLRGLNAMMTRRNSMRGKGERKVKCDERPMFYNPMWNRLGDWDAPAGSFYWHKSPLLGYFWHMLDQVLVRGKIAKVVKDARILTNSGCGTLLTRHGLPNRDISDHLPLFVRLTLTEGP